MNRSRFPLPASLIAIVLAGCRPAAVRELAAPTVLEAPAPALPGAFSLSGDPAAPYLFYLDRESRALVLTAADGSSPRAYLDRITDLPEQDPLLGAHLLFADGDDIHLLYLDRQSEDSRLLKHFKRSGKSGTSWIDVLPASGKPLAAFLSGNGSLDLFVERDQALFRESPQRDSEPVRSPFSSAGRVSRIAAEGFQGFTVFDALSHRLLLFRIRGNGIEQLAIARFGEAHDSLLAPDGRLQAVVYDPRSFRILLYSTEDPASGFDIQPVTLSRGTSSLALVRLPDGLGFLYNETAARSQRRYLISLLHPWSGDRYQKTVLYRSARPIASLHAAQARDVLYVAFLEDNLRVLRVEFNALNRK